MNYHGLKSLLTKYLIGYVIILIIPFLLSFIPDFTDRQSPFYAIIYATLLLVHFLNVTIYSRTIIIIVFSFVVIYRFRWIFKEQV